MLSPFVWCKRFSMSKIYFIAGTDTGVGKTTISVRLLKQYEKEGLSTLGIKPVASGCHVTGGRLQNNDALALQSASTIKLPYDAINPFAYAEPIAPHIAASKCGDDLSVEKLLNKTRDALSVDADVILVEGVGGWCVPLNDDELMSDFVSALNLQVILVVGMRVGCLNHAIQTFHQLCSDKIELVSWVANCIDPNMCYIGENIVALEKYFQLPCKEVVEFRV